jgi:hypothetical protein
MGLDTGNERNGGRHQNCDARCAAVDIKGAEEGSMLLTTRGPPQFPSSFSR